MPSSFCTPPSIFTQGDTVIFQETNPIYPATDWTMTFVLSRDGINLSNTDATPTGPTGSDFLITLPKELTATLAPGRAKWTELVSNATERNYNRSGYLSIVPDPTQSITPTPEMTALANIKAQIASGVANLSKSRSFNGQMSTDRDLKELMDARDRLQVIVNAQLVALGVKQGDTSRRIIFSFCD